MSVGAHWDVESSRQTEIRQFDHTLSVNQKVLRLQITVVNTSRVAEMQRLSKVILNEKHIIIFLR